MNRTNTKELVNQWGKWLGTESWDYFTTITYKHNVSVKSNYRIMDRLEKSLDKTMLKMRMFWIMEYSNYGSTHNHLLLQGENINTDFKNVVCGLDETRTYTLFIKVTFNEIGQIFSVCICRCARRLRIVHLF